MLTFFFNKLKFFLSPKKEIIWVNTHDALKTICNDLRTKKIIAIDTEFDWRNTYKPKMSLVQIATKEKIFLIDCLKFSNLNGIKKILEDNKVLLICHSCRSDCTVLSNSLGIKMTNIFDVQIADKEIYKGDIRKYEKLVKDYMKIDLFQTETNSNWLQRPLSSSQVKYACEDVDFLIDIYKIQKKMLSTNNLYKILELSQSEASLGNMDLKEMRLVKNKKKLSKKDIKIFLWREDLALRKNVPPNFIFDEKKITKLSKVSLNNTNFRREIMTILGDSDLTNKFISEFL